MSSKHLFSWYDLREYSILYLKDGILLNLLEKGKVKAGNIYKLSIGLGMTAPSIYDSYNGKTQGITVKKLALLLKYLEVDPQIINSEIISIRKGTRPSIDNPRFPFNLKTPHGAHLLGCIVSDGTIYKDTQARGVHRTKYSTSDLESKESFISAVNSVFGNVHIQEEVERNNSYLKVGSSAIARTLLRAGATSGNKTDLNPPSPWLIKENSSLWAMLRLC